MLNSFMYIHKKEGTGMNIRFNCFPGGTFKALTLSYDDGTLHDIRLVSILNTYGIKATFHLNSGILDQEGYVSAKEVKALYAGHEISVHTVSHPFLDELPREAIIHEVLEDRQALEHLSGYPVRGMSYPYGSYNEEVTKLLPALGIEYSRTVHSTGSFAMPQQPLEWNPTCHHNAMLKAGEQLIALTGDMPWKRKLSLLYVWGHSYEFENHGNWHEIESFCRMMSAQKDIWFATNMEIIDYQNALGRLQFSADRTLVHNPSAISVWITVDQSPVEIKPGELKKLV